MKEKTNTVFEELVVVKRSGQRVSFNSTKIALAIKRAFDSVIPSDNEEKINIVYEDVLNFIKKNYIDRKTINVEDIQDIIESKLKEKEYKNVYNSFSDYRIRRAASRKAFNIKQQHKFVKAIERIVNENKENKNINNKPNEILLDFGKTISAEYTKAYILDSKYLRAHDEGSIYIHNLDYFNLGSLSSTHLNFENTVKEEFPLKMLCTAINAKEEIDGEITISKIDYILLPLLIKRFKTKFKEKLNRYLDVSGYLEYINYKKAEEIIDKEDSINIDIDIFNQYTLNKKVKEIFEVAYNDSLKKIEELLHDSFRRLLISLNNNRQENKKYSISLGTNNSFEGLMINNCYLNIIEELESLENVTTIFKIKRETNIEVLNKVSNLVIKSKNISFSFVESTYNKDPENEVEYFSNGKRIFENNSSEEKSSIGKMIVSSVSINMGRLGFKHQNEELLEFYNELNDLLELSTSILIMIFETIGNKNKENYQIIFNNNIIDDDKLEQGQKIRKIIKKGVLNIELAGIPECVKLLEKNSEKQKELIKDIIKHVNQEVKKMTEETKLNFIVSETSKHRPLNKLMAFDKAIYGIKKDITDKNSYSKISDLFEFKDNIKNDFKYIGDYQKLLSGGNFVTLELPKNITTKKIIEMFHLAIEEDIGFIRFNIRK